jgi:uncharacterized protein YdaL
LSLSHSDGVLAATKQFLILHDSTGPTGFQGKEFAIMLRNLLGHFDGNTTISPVKSYSPGTINKMDASFYIGSTFDEFGKLSSPQEKANYKAFASDAAKTSKPMVWMNYNLNEISDAKNWNPAWGAESFERKMGYKYIGIKKENDFNRVTYKNVELYKGVVPWANPGANLTGCIPDPGGVNAYACSRELNAISITVPSKAKVKATTYFRATKEASNIAKEPYITRSKHFWFFGDMPLSHISEEDRYLALADLLHDIVGSGITQQPLQAMVRFEDVSSGTDTDSLEMVMSYLESEGVPFAIAAVPVFKDPYCAKKGARPRTNTLARSEVANTIRPYYTKGLASIIAHGYTHQSAILKNPYNGLSGDDFEFYRVTINSDNSLNYQGGVPEDSQEWAKTRMTDSRQALESAGFTAFAWEAPHYFATDADYRSIKDIYSTHYGRMIYTNIDGPKGRRIGQFFPYVIHSDYYGYHQIPENMGNIEPTPIQGYRPLSPADLIRHAKKLKVVRDSVASFFYHPFLETNYLREVVEGYKDLGYKFIAPCSLGTCPDTTKNIAPGVQTPNNDKEDKMPECISSPTGNNTTNTGGSSGLAWLLLLFITSLTRKWLKIIPARIDNGLKL